MDSNDGPKIGQALFTPGLNFDSGPATPGCTVRISTGRKVEGKSGIRHTGSQDWAHFDKPGSRPSPFHGHFLARQRISWLSVRSNDQIDNVNQR